MKKFFSTPLSLIFLSILCLTPTVVLAQAPRLQSHAGASALWVQGELLVKIAPAPNSPSEKSLKAVNTSMLTQVEQALNQQEIKITPLFNSFAGNPRSLSTANNRDPAWLKLSAKNDDIAAVACESLKSKGLISECQTNYLHRVDTLPNDEYVSSTGTDWKSCSWGMSHADLWGAQMINAFDAWQSPGCPPSGCRGQGVVVAVLDTGIDFNHPDIKNNLFVNSAEDINHNGRFDPFPASQGGDLNGVDDDENGYVDDVVGANTIDPTQSVRDDFGHGTHVAGTIAAEADNGIGIAGIAPEAKIFSVKAISAQGSGTSIDLAEGMRYIVDFFDRDKNGSVDVPLVINNSWGSEPGYTDYILEEATRYAYSKGAVLIFAAGNSSVEASTLSPNSLDEGIMVASVTPEKSCSTFSNYGHRVAVAAPGGGGGYEFQACSPTAPYPQNVDRNILSLLAADSVFAKDYPSLIVGEQYLRLSGTSMATPHVSAVAALLLSQRPGLSPQEVKTSLILGTDPSIYEGYRNYGFYFGSGIIDAVKVLQLPTVSNLALSYEQDDLPMHNTRQPFVIKGSILAESWRLLLHRYRNYQLVSSEVIATGSSSTSGLIATFDASGISYDSTYWLEFEGTSAGQTMRTRTPIYFDTTLRVNWPQKVGQSSLGGGWVIWTTPAVLIDDLNGDGISEIVVPSYGEGGLYSSSGLAFFNPFGDKLKETTVFAIGNLLDLLSSDINNDGLKEVVVISDRSIATLSASGALLNSFAFPTTGVKEGAIADIDADGFPEIVVPMVVTDTDNSVSPPKGIELTSLYVFNSDLTYKPGWENGRIVAYGSSTNSAPLLSDLDGDGTIEIVLGPLNDHRILVLDRYGNPWSNFNFTPPNLGVCGHPPMAMADLDADGQKEIIASMQNKMYVVRSDGSPMPGWPIDIGRTNFAQPATLADLNADSLPEIILGAGWYKSFIALGADGKTIPGSAGVSADYSEWSSTIGSTIAGLVDSDSETDITQQGLFHNITTLAKTGEELRQWTHRRTRAQQFMPSLHDVDGDGKNEMVELDENGWVFVWDTDGDACAFNPWPEYRGDAARSSDYSKRLAHQEKPGCGQSIDGLVVDENGSPVADALIDGGALGRRRSDKDGKFHFFSVSGSAAYQLQVSHPDFEFPNYHGILPNSPSLPISGRRVRGVLSGTIMFGTNPLAGVTVDAGSLGNVVSDTSGHFSFAPWKFGSTTTIHLSLGDYDFTPNDFGITFSSSMEVSIAAQHKPVSISGVVVTHNGTALKGVKVSSDAFGSTRSNSHGFFSIPNVPYGSTYKLHFSKQGFYFPDNRLSAEALGLSIAKMIRALPNNLILKGIVRDSKGRRLSAVTVTGVGKRITNNDGTFTYKHLRYGKKIELQINKPHYKTKKVVLRLRKNTTLNIKLRRQGS